MTMFFLGEGSSMGQIDPWNRDLDNPTNFLIDISINETSKVQNH